MNGKEIIKKLKKAGWHVIRIASSHHILSNGTKKATVPVHGKKDVKIGTVKSIEKQTGVKLL